MFPNKKYVRCASGNKLHIIGVGVLPHGLGKAYLVPQATRNLLSVSQITAQGKSITFKKDHAYIDGELFGSLQKGLYILSGKYSGASVRASDDEILLVSDVSSIDDTESEQTLDINLRRDLDLPHRRFGHCDIHLVLRMIRLNTCDGLKVAAHVSDPNRFSCDSCLTCKARKVSRNPYLKLRRNDSAVNKDLYFKVLWSDVLGPLEPTALNGYRYGVTFTESTSRYRYFYPLQHKDQTLSVFKSLVAEVSAQGFKVKLLRSDNGGEFTSKEFAEFCVAEYIEQRFTPPNTPSANSVSERFNRVLAERARSMMHSAKLPKFLWASAMLTVTYIYNRTISPEHESKSPYELLFGVRPNVSNLRAYGCRAYLYNFGAVGKLDDRAIKGALVGYDMSSSAYLIYVPDSNSIRRSGHVAFDEHQLLFTIESKLAAERFHLQSTLKSKVNSLSTLRTATPSLTPSVLGKRLDDAQLNLSSTASVSKKSAAIDATTRQFPASPKVNVSSSDIVDTDAIPARNMKHTTTSLLDATPIEVPVDTLRNNQSHGHLSEQTAVPLVPIIAKPTILPLISRSGRTIKATPPLSSYRDSLHFVDEESDFQFDMFAFAAEIENVNTANDAPTSFRSILSRADSAEWLAAIASENASLSKHNVFEVASELPFGKHAIKAKYILKRKADGRYKARLVAKGFTQIEGLDYFDVFAPVVSKNSLRLLLSLAASNDWDIHQLDVETAFLYGELEEDLYLEAPEGSAYPKGTILKLRKSLYGLKQAPRNWNRKLDEFITSQGFNRCAIDSSVYTRGSGSDAVILAVYVDDLLIFGNDSMFITSFKSALCNQFSTKDLGQVSDILGMTVTRDRAKRTISLKQTNYIRKLASQYGFNPDEVKSNTSVPMSKATWNTAVDMTNPLAADVKTSADAEFPYQSLLGGILYTNVCCRPDISFAVSALASHNSNPKRMH